MRPYVKPSMSNYAIKSSRKKCFRKLLIVNDLKRVIWGVIGRLYCARTLCNKTSKRKRLSNSKLTLK
jgi:hypothetical protein